MNSEIAVRSEDVEPSYQGGTALADLRSRAMSVSKEQMLAGLDEYKDKRDAFRGWLLSQLVPGVHFGYVPGTEPKFDGAGNLVVKSWDKRSNGYKETKIAPDQWKAKPSLYKAGADFICDLMGLRAEFTADSEGHRQLTANAVPDRDGKIWPIVVYSCRLISRSTGEIVSDGRGARRLNQKGGDENNTVKMCQKAAKVDAVLNAYGLSDLFTQDIEDRPGPEKHANPEQSPNAPKAKSRGERVTEAELSDLTGRFKKQMGHLQPSEMFDRWKVFCLEATGHQFANIKLLDEWTRTRLNQVMQKMEMEWSDG